MQLKPVCVSDSLKKGTKFVKWDDVSEGRRGGARAGHPRAGCVGVGRGARYAMGRSSGRGQPGAHRLPAARLGWVTEGDSFARALFLLGDLELTSLLGLASACLLRDLSLWGQWN